MRKMMVLAAALFLLLGSRGAERPPAAESPPPAERELVVGAFSDSYPHSFHNERGQLTGFAVELTEALGREMKTRIRFAVHPYPELQQRLEAGEVDFLQMLRDTPDQAVWADFSIPYIYAQLILLLRRDAPPVQQLSDLGGRRLALNRNNSTAQLFFKTLPATPEIVDAETGPDALRLVERGEADATILGRNLALSQIEKMALTNVVEYDGQIPRVEQRQSYAVRKGDKELLGRINEALAHLYQSGELDRIYARWFGRFEPTKITREEGIALLALILGLGVVLTTWFALRQRRLVRLIAEQQITLQNSEKIFRNLFNNTEVGMFRSTLDGSRMLTVNDKLLEILGWSREEVVGSPSVRHWADPQQREVLTRRLKAEQRVVDFECTIRTKQGDLRQCLVSMSLYPEDETIEGSIIDITERKRTEEERQQLETRNRQLQKSESLGRMAGAIAHVFNNRLQGVMLGLELAMDSNARNPEALAHLTEAMQSARSAAEVSSGMLTYLGQSQGTSELLDLSEVCRQGVSLLSAVVPRGTSLETNLPAHGPKVSADATQLHLILTNLVTNAIEARGEGRGTIRLTVKTVTADQIPAAIRFPVDWRARDPIYACVEVADSGCGIPAADLEKICDPFFSSKFTGRGLGLPIVLGIMRERKGVLTVESEIDRGSTFRVFLPVAPNSSPPRPDSREGKKIVASGCTLLVIEDEPVVRKTVALALERFGFGVLTAGDGAEGVKIFQEHRAEIQCVLCDVTMPRLNGWDTLAALRLLAPGIPVILASGHGESQVMKGHHGEQPNWFLHKPYEFKELVDAVHCVLPERPV